MTPWAAEVTLRDELFRGLGPDALYAHHATDALFHIFRVAGGLDSQVLGESQILGQLKDATQRARDAGTLGDRLGGLLDMALVVGKRVRSETKVGEGTLSIARAGVELAQKVLGDLSRAPTVIVGAGETGQLVATHLAELGGRNLTFVNRSPARAEEAVARFGGRALPIERLPEALRDAALTVVSVDVTEPLVRPEHFDATRLKRRDDLALVVDLSIPRAVDPKVAKLDGLLLHDLDGLERIVQGHHRDRQREVERAEAILVQEVHKFLALGTYARMKPVITGLEERFLAIRDALLAEGVARRCGGPGRSLDPPPSGRSPQSAQAWRPALLE